MIRVSCTNERKIYSVYNESRMYYSPRFIREHATFEMEQEWVCLSHSVIKSTLDFFTLYRTSLQKLCAEWNETNGNLKEEYAVHTAKVVTHYRKILLEFSCLILQRVGKKLVEENLTSKYYQFE